MKKNLLIFGIILIAGYFFIVFSSNTSKDDEDKDVEYVDLIGDFDRNNLTKKSYRVIYF